MSSLVQHAPKFTETDAVRIAHDLFGFNVSAKKLPSERDQNFYLTTSNGKAYVLKVANSKESADVLDFQNQAMMHIARHGNRSAHDSVAVPQVCASLKREQISSVKGVEGAVHLVRLLTYLPGKPFARVKPHSESLLVSLGRFFGRIDGILVDFDHPAVHRSFHWDLKNAGRILHNYLGFIKEPANRDVVQRLQERFKEKIEPLLPNMRTSVIHNDGNDYNVLVEPKGQWLNRVTGVIDFGDMVHTYTVSEVAIACAYAMLDKADPLTVAAHIVAGYHQNYPLTDQELDVLFDLICMRLCMSVCHSANQSQLEPDNEYLRVSEKPAWMLLKQLAGIHPRFARYVFRNACGLPAVPQSAKIVEWLQNHTDGFASIVGQDLRSENLLVFDLSVGSTLLGGDGLDTVAVTDCLFRQLKKANVKVGIGRYDEARLFYSAEQFKIQADEMPQARTVHLGIDLYMQRNAPVYAPLDGWVHSYKNNSAQQDYGPTIVLQHRTDDSDCFYTLYGHLSPDSLSGLTVGTAIAQGQSFARIGDPQTNGGWPPHLHFQIVIDMLGENGDFPGVSRPQNRDIWSSISPDPNLVLGIPQTCLLSEEASHEDLVAFRRKNLGRNLSISYHKPLKIVRGKGQYLFADDGQAYLDGVNNVCHVGHCHPHVVAAARRQMPVLNTNTRYLHDTIIKYAQRLLSKFPESLSVCYFVCTGSEANELALRLARTYTGRQDIITVDGAYHGNTQTLIDISPYKHDGPGGHGAPPWVHKVMMPDGYRGPYKRNAADSGVQYATHVADTVERIQGNGKGPAAFICESMLGCAGQIVLPVNYLHEAFKSVRAGGGICIVDEVQVGFGRVGSHFWAFETQGVVPDIVTLGKPMGNGHPLAAVVTTAEIADAFDNGMEYFNTFGGNPVSCAIGMAVLDVIENEGLQENAFKVGNHLLDGLKALMAKYPLIGDVRGLGLYAGVELVTNRRTLNPAPKHADYIINRMKDFGILISTDGPSENILKMKPPIVFTEKNADAVIQALDKILSEDCLQV